MNCSSFTTVSAICVFLAVGCASAGARPTARAIQVERLQCSGSAVTKQDDQVLKSATVLKVSPIYGHVHTSYNDYEARVNGATILVQPPAGVSVEQMNRVVQCHSARALLGEIDQTQLSNDPYWLPGTWLNIDVKQEPGGYAISIVADNVEHGLKVLARANAQSETRLATNAVAPSSERERTIMVAGQ